MIDNLILLLLPTIYMVGGIGALLIICVIYAKILMLFFDRFLK